MNLWITSIIKTVDLCLALVVGLKYRNKKRMSMDKLLIQEPPLQVLPTLAMAIGLKEALLLQQIHYWTRLSTNIEDGHTWVYNSVTQWQQQLPFWSERTIWTMIKKLETLDLIISGSFNKAKFDRTKWYRINYANLAILNSQILRKQAASLAEPIPETTTDTTHIPFSTTILKEASPSKPEQLQDNSTNDIFEMMGLEQIDIEDASPAVDTLTTGKAITAQLGDPKINKMLASFEEAVGIKLNRVKQQRYAAKRLLDRYGEETVDRAIKAAALVRQEEYAPMILNLEDLWNKWDKLATFYQRKQHEQETQKQGVSIITED